MIDKFIYWLMQTLGYRLVYWDWSLDYVSGYRSECSWLRRPEWAPGTYREEFDPQHNLRYVGYGVDK